MIVQYTKGFIFSSENTYLYYSNNYNYYIYYVVLEGKEVHSVLNIPSNTSSFPCCSFSLDLPFQPGIQNTNSSIYSFNDIYILYYIYRSSNLLNNVFIYLSLSLPLYSDMIKAMFQFKIHIFIQSFIFILIPVYFYSLTLILQYIPFMNR